jgi:hypothetical protein
MTFPVNPLARYISATTVLARHLSLLRHHEHIFLLSHMRGYTTLMSHILGSHPEISGYSETSYVTRKPYRSFLDLLKIRLVVAFHQNYKPGCRYVLDKINLNDPQIADSILAKRSTKWIIMIREPLATIRSIVALHRKYVRQGSPAGPSIIPANPESAANYYCDRIAGLLRIVERLQHLGQSMLIIKAEELVEQPRPVLNQIEQYLELRTRLSEEYTVFDRTGRWDAGDTSEFIWKRSIVRRRPQHDEIAIPPEIAAQTQANYERSLASLRRWSMVAVHLLVVYLGDALDFAAAGMSFN